MNHMVPLGRIIAWVLIFIGTVGSDWIVFELSERVDKGKWVYYVNMILLAFLLAGGFMLKAYS